MTTNNTRPQRRVALISTVLPALVLAAGMTTAAHGADKVVATVNGTAIHQSELDTLVNKLGGKKKVTDTKPLIGELVKRELVYQDAMSKKLDKRADVKSDLALVRRQVLMSAALQQAMKENPVTDKEVKQAYDKLKASMDTQELKASHILLKTKDEAKNIIAKLDKGDDFAELAKKYSTGPSGKKGGDLGWFAPHQMVAQFADAAKKLKKGTYTKEPVQTQFGWHVIKLEDTRAVEPPSLDDVKDRLHKSLEQRHLQAYLEKLTQEAKIDIK